MRKKPTNASEYTVSEISGALRKTIEETYGNVRVRGEISGYRGPHASGHAYFALKDQKARLDAVVWRTILQRLKFPPEEGLEVIASGRLSSYAGSSRYQIIIDSIEPAGAGALMALLEERRKKLAAEGLFDENRKQLLPFMPTTIGVITSPTGAVIRDIIHRVSDRFPLHIIVWPVRVQGETSGAEAAAAIRGFNALSENGQNPHNIARPDLLIVARGGGSLEDLWGFNDEDLIRAAAQSSLPIISAIGHETDWTLLDYVADKRAPTPTGAAEIAVPVKAELNAAVFELANRLAQAEKRLLMQNRQNYGALARALPSADRLLADPRRRVDENGERLGFALQRTTQFKRTNFSTLASRFSPALFARLTQQKRQDFMALARALPSKQRLIAEPQRQLNEKAAHFAFAFKQLVQQKFGLYNQLAPRLSSSPVERVITANQQNTHYLAKRLNASFVYNTNQHLQRLQIVSKLIKNLSIDSILKRGFALVQDDKGQTLNLAQSIQVGQNLKLHFSDGHVLASAQKILPDASNPPSMPQEKSQKNTTKPVAATSKPIATSSNGESAKKKQSQKKSNTKNEPRQGNLF